MILDQPLKWKAHREINAMQCSHLKPMTKEARKESLSKEKEKRKKEMKETKNNPTNRV